MSERRDDPMRLWIGKWTPERQGTVQPRTRPAEQVGDKPAVDAERASTAD